MEYAEFDPFFIILPVSPSYRTIEEIMQITVEFYDFCYDDVYWEGIL